MQRVVYVILAAFIFGGIALSSTTISTTSERSRTELSAPTAARAIDALDRCVQNRFVRTDKGFGMSRLAAAVHNTHVFVPTTDAENRAVRDFETLNMRVVMYVVSRQQPRFGPFGAETISQLIQGPVFVNPAPRVDMRSPAGAPVSVQADARLAIDLPDNDALRTNGARSLKAFTDRESESFEIDSWRFLARPVRASDTACLTCHNPLPRSDGAAPSAGEPFRLGDALGAVLYGYQALSARP